MAKVTMYGTRSCPFCLLAEAHLKQKGISHVDKILVNIQSSALAEMVTRSGRKTVPQIFVGDVHVGGYDDLVDLDRAGRLDQLLAA